MFFLYLVAFKVYDINQDGFISNGELFTVLKMMVGNNLKEVQLQQIVDKTILQFDLDGDGKISYSEFCNVSSFLKKHFDLFQNGSNSLIKLYLKTSVLFFFRLLVIWMLIKKWLWMSDSF